MNINKLQLSRLSTNCLPAAAPLGCLLLFRTTKLHSLLHLQSIDRQICKALSHSFLTLKGLIYLLSLFTPPNPTANSICHFLHVHLTTILIIRGKQSPDYRFYYYTRPADLISNPIRPQPPTQITRLFGQRTIYFPIRVAFTRHIQSSASQRERKYTITTDNPALSIRPIYSPNSPYIPQSLLVSPRFTRRPPKTVAQSPPNYVNLPCSLYPSPCRPGASPPAGARSSACAPGPPCWSPPPAGPRLSSSP